FTTEDILFTAQVEQDEELPNFRDASYRFVERIEALDARTVVVTWKQPYILADTLFMEPIASHIMEPVYQKSKSTFAKHPYWSDEFVGTGPFRIGEWVRGSHVRLSANDRYILGRPKLDEIEMRFIPDDNTLI